MLTQISNHETRLRLLRLILLTLLPLANATRSVLMRFIGNRN